MITLFGCLLGATTISEFDSNASSAANYLIAAPDLEDMLVLGQLTAAACRDNATTSQGCADDTVATFKAAESQTPFNVCFKSDGAFDKILMADQIINLIIANGNYFVMGEAINACDNGRRNIREAAYIEITDCKSK